MFMFKFIKKFIKNVLNWSLETILSIPTSVYVTTLQLVSKSTMIDTNTILHGTPITSDWNCIFNYQLTLY